MLKHWNSRLLRIRITKPNCPLVSKIFWVRFETFRTDPNWFIYFVTNVPLAEGQTWYKKVTSLLTPWQWSVIGLLLQLKRVKWYLPNIQPWWSWWYDFIRWEHWDIYSLAAPWWELKTLSFLLSPILLNPGNLYVIILFTTSCGWWKWVEVSKLRVRGL